MSWRAGTVTDDRRAFGRLALTALPLVLVAALCIRPVKLSMDDPRVTRVSVDTFSVTAEVTADGDWDFIEIWGRASGGTDWLDAEVSPSECIISYGDTTTCTFFVTLPSATGNGQEQTVGLLLQAFANIGTPDDSEGAGGQESKRITLDFGSQSTAPTAGATPPPDSSEQTDTTLPTTDAPAFEGVCFANSLSVQFESPLEFLDRGWGSLLIYLKMPEDTQPTFELSGDPRLADPSYVKVEQVGDDLWQLTIDGGQPFPLGTHEMELSVNAGDETCHVPLTIVISEYVPEA